RRARAGRSRPTRPRIARACTSRPASAGRASPSPTRKEDPVMATERSLVYPHPKDATSSVSGGVPGGMHPTAGLAHNWAFDYMARGGTLVLAVEKAKVWKLSGHDPDVGVIGGDIFGWNTYLMTPDGVIYFYTHQGFRSVTLGQAVRKGQVIGQV